MGSIFDGLATANYLQSSGRRLPPGTYLIEVRGTKMTAPTARSGQGAVIEFRVISGPLAGQDFSSVPKFKNPEVAMRELAQFTTAVHGVDLNTVVGKQEELAQWAKVIEAAFVHGNYPLTGKRCFVTATLERGKQPPHNEYTRHLWEPATAALAQTRGIVWPADGAVAPSPQIVTHTQVPSAVPGLPPPAPAPPAPPQMPPQAPRPALPAPALPAPATPGAPTPPAVPQIPQAMPPAPPQAPRPPVPPAPPAVVPAAPKYPGYHASADYPGWQESDTVPGFLWHPESGETARME